ncbi:MAG: hypothetical protein TH68_04270, partial [Candidatus Synechococcus spongiarum 142]
MEGGSTTYTVKLSAWPNTVVTVTVDGMGSDVSVDTDHGMEGVQTTLSFDYNNWETEQTVTVGAVEDGNTSSEAVTLTHTTTNSSFAYSVSKNLRVTVIDNDAPNLVVLPEAVTVAEADSATYTVRLVKEPTADVTVTVSGMGSGVSVDTDPWTQGQQTSLSFTTADWNAAQTVTVNAAPDENLSSEEVRLSHTATGGDYASVSQELVVTVTDDDTPGLVFSPEAVTVAEAGSATYTVQLAHQPSAAVTVRVRVRGMGGSVSVDTDSGMEGEQTSLSFTTANWNIARTVTVRAAADENLTPETVRLSHNAAGGNYASVSKELVVTVTDAASLMFSPEAVTVAEADSVTYTVQLAVEPAADVTVTVRGMGSGVSVDTDSGMESEQTSLSFTTSNWNTARTVTVSAAADENLISETVTLSHAATGGYASVSQELVVTVT